MNSCGLWFLYFNDVFVETQPSLIAMESHLIRILPLPFVILRLHFYPMNSASSLFAYRLIKKIMKILNGECFRGDHSRNNENLRWTYALRLHFPQFFQKLRGHFLVPTWTSSAGDFWNLSRLHHLFWRTLVKDRFYKRDLRVHISLYPPHCDLHQLAVVILLAQVLQCY